MVQTTPDVNLNIIDFPDKGRELVTENEDGSYTILINAHLSREGQYLAYQHAMSHILEGDFDSDETADEIEAKRHGGII